MGLFASCLLILVIATGFRDVIRRRWKGGGTGKRVEGLERRLKTDMVSGSIVPGGKQRKAVIGIPTRDEESAQRNLGRNQRGDR
jgi:hypothetical protein